MAPKIKKAIKKVEQKKAQEAIDVNTKIPEDQKIKIGGNDLHGINPKKTTKKAQVNSEPKTPTKVAIDFESVKKQFETICKVSTDSYGMVSLKDPETEAVLGYLMNRKKDGQISHYTRKDNSWIVTERFKSQAEIDNLFEQVQKELRARERWNDALTPKYVHGDFVTIDKTQMIERLKSLL
jgi:hypothetical protein